MINPYTLSDNELFYGNIGLCFSGNTVNAFALRDALADQIQGLLMPSYSFESIANLAFEQYERISKKLCSALLSSSGQAAVAITGWCYESQKIKAFNFHPSENGGNTYLSTVILENDGDYLFFGSGKKKADTLFSQHHNKEGRKIALLDTLHTVIADKETPNVGGGIRIGTFDRNNSFKSWWETQPA